MKQNENDLYNIGSLLNFRNLNNEQKDIFIKLLSDDCSYQFQLLFNILDDNILVLQLIDIFADTKIIFPSRKKIYKLLEKIQIYTYVKHKNYSDDSYKLMAKQYKKRISQIKDIVTRIDYLLNNGKFKDIEKLENKGE